MEKEIWKQVPQFESYWVSNYGRIKSTRCSKEKIMKLVKTHNGYMKINFLDVDGKIKSFRVHRLVAEAFIPNPENKATVNHKDKNRKNNHVSNLEWNTNLENTNHKIEQIRINEKLLNGLCENCRKIMAQLVGH